MTSTANQNPHNGTVPLILSFLGVVAAFIAVGSLLFWIDPAGTTASCHGAAECIAGKLGLLKLEVFGGGIGGGLFLTVGILGILKKPSAH